MKNFTIFINTMLFLFIGATSLQAQKTTEKPLCPTPINLLTNGSFTYGNDGSFQSGLPQKCNSCTAGSYCVGNQFKAKCSAWPANSFDHTFGNASGNYLLIDGHPSRPATIWADSVCVCEGVTYTFSFWAKSVYPISKQNFDVGLMIDGLQNNVNIAQTTPAWTQYEVTWISNKKACIPISIQQLTGGAFRDFGIDDIFFGFCCDACSASTADEDDCIVDIDTTIVRVSCGNIVDIASVFDGTPAAIKYTIYDSLGVVIFTASNTTSFTFTLPGTGIFYGVVEASCGGGDARGGDEDEDVFEIMNLPPVADFVLNSTFTCVNGNSIRTINTTDYSNEEGTLSYLYRVKDIATGTITSYTVAEPVFNLDVKKAYDVELIVTDQKGCTAQKNIKVGAAAKCKSKFDWWYSWCEDSCAGPQKVRVNFENRSKFTNCAFAPEFTWNYGDGHTEVIAGNPSHEYTVPCAGKSFNVSLTMTIGKPGDADYCQAVWDTMITIDRTKITYQVTKICCDGLVFFSTNAVKGKWSTPGSLGIPKWPVVSKRIWKQNGIQIGQNYRQYYSAPGTYSINISGGETENHNRCSTKEIRFTINSIECFNRNVRVKRTDVVDGVSVKYKFTALALPFVHRMKSKISARGGKRLKEISTDFAGNINKKGADGCFCAPQSVSGASGLRTNKRKAKAVTSTNGKFRIGMNKATANYYVKTNSGVTRTWQLSLGFPPCDYPWLMFF